MFCRYKKEVVLAAIGIISIAVVSIPIELLAYVKNVSTTLRIPYDAAGNLVSTTDPNNKTRQYSYDALNRRTATIRPSGATDSFGYDGVGRNTTYTNSEGNVYSMGYDPMGRITAATNALGEQIFRAWYDLNGNTISRIDGNGNVINYTYDALNRLIARSAESAQSVQSVDRFSYDAVGNILTASNDTARLSFTYDAMDRLATASTTLTTDHLPPTTYQSGYAYDAGGLVTNLTYATGKSVSYTHDQDGLLTAVKDWLGHTWTLTRDAMGKVTGVSSPDDNNATFAYDAANRLTSWSVGAIAGRTITYDDAGRRIRDDITAGAIPKPTLQRTAKNTFDAADKLISASVRYGQGTNSTPHITETFSYDGNGAMTNILTQSCEGHEESLCSLSYNSQNQLRDFASSCETNHFQYDALGNRIKTGDTLWIPNHADPLKRPLIECDSNGSVIRYYIWGDSRLLGFIDSSGTLTVAHSDETGNVIALTDTNGNVIYTANYGPHGEDWGSTGINPTPFTWLGGYGVQTINSGTPLRLYLTRHRVYSATLNRFLSTDPLGISGGLNLYTYGEGNPLAYIDPLGLCAESVWGAATSGFVEGLGGGFSILANTFSFGGTDALGWTDSAQYQGWEYDASRISANVARGATMGAATAGLGTLAAGGSTAAQVGYGTVLAANAATGGYQVGSGINSVADGNYLTGAGQIIGGGLAIAGSIGGAGAIVPKGTSPVQDLPRTGSALKTDPYHAFPDVVDNFAASATKTQLRSGATLYQAKGSLNGADGRFEWIVDRGNVTHRLFVPSGTINGVPIKP